jgi:curved DNA-binding protein CbpA
LIVVVTPFRRGDEMTSQGASSGPMDPSATSDCPSIFIPKDISLKVIEFMKLQSGSSIRDGVELILKHDLALAGTSSSDGVDVGSYLKYGLSFLAQSPYETLGVPLTADEATIRKAYKKMALKYHPDKNPATTPLFQAIHSAYEKLSTQTVRIEPSSSSPPPPATSKPPQGPPPSSSNSSSNTEKKTKSHEKEEQRAFTESQQRAKMKERMKQEAKKKEEEKEETSQREQETGREKERKEAEARATERRAKTGYGNRQPLHQRDHVQRKERSSTGEDYLKNPQPSSSSPAPSAAASSSEPSPSPSSTTSAPTPTLPIIPIPVGLRGEVVDVGTVQLEWLPISQWDPPPSVIAKYQVELSWREILYPDPKGYGQIYKPDPQWEIGSLMITGDKVMKRNLNPGSVYEFSIRYRIPASIDKKQGLSAVRHLTSLFSSSNLP